MASELTQEEVDQIADALADGQKIKAIKLFRDATGRDVKAAKEFIDSLTPKLIEQDPEKYASLAAQGKGCASVILLCLATIAAAGPWILKI